MEVWYESPVWASGSLALIVYGLAGGLIVALWLIRLNRRAIAKASARLPTHDRVAIDMINLAHIRVVGVGGLGLVAMCAVVALYIPQIGISLTAGFLFGTVFALIMIVRRSKAGPISSSSQSPGANTTLMIDAPPPPETPAPDPHRGRQQRTIAAASWPALP